MYRYGTVTKHSCTPYQFLENLKQQFTFASHQYILLINAIYETRGPHRFSNNRSHQTIARTDLLAPDRQIYGIPPEDYDNTLPSIHAIENNPELYVHYQVFKHICITHILNSFTVFPHILSPATTKFHVTTTGISFCCFNVFIPEVLKSQQAQLRVTTKQQLS